MYAAQIIQPATLVAHLTRGLAAYAYLSMNPGCLRQPSPVDLIFFTDASGESARNPLAGGATARLTYTTGEYHMDQYTGHTIYGASFPRELGQAMADNITRLTTTLPANLPHTIIVWLLVDAAVNAHPLLRIARQPLHKATASSLSTQALMLWKALHHLAPNIQLHIVHQESHRHRLRNGRVNLQSVHHLLTHVPALQIPDLEHNLTHLQHLLPKPVPYQTPRRVPEDAPYTSHNRAYYYPDPVQHLARVLET